MANGWSWHDEIQTFIDEKEDYITITDIELPIPPEIGNIYLATDLSLSSDSKNVDNLPESIGNLINLESMYIQIKYLSVFPKSIGNLVNIEHLGISGTNISILPETIGNLVKLQRLNISHNKLTSLPTTIVNFSILTQLHINNNLLNTLPSGIGQLINLKVLDISNNQINILPNELSQLIKLTNLDISFNPLSEFPVEFDALEYLRVLKLTGTDITHVSNTMYRRITTLMHNRTLDNVNDQAPSSIPIFNQPDSQIQPQGIAYEIHNEFDKFQDRIKFLYDVIDPTRRYRQSFPKMKDITDILTTYINSDKYDASSENKINQTAKLNMFMEKRMYDLPSDENHIVLTTISPIIRYVMKQPKEFINYYIQTLIHDSFHAYADIVPPDANFGDTIGCAKGIFERFILLLGDTAYAMCPNKSTCIISESDQLTRNQYWKLAIISGKIMINDSDVTKDWARSVMKGEQPGINKQSSVDELGKNLQKYIINEYKSLHLISQHESHPIDQQYLDHISKYVGNINSILSDFIDEEYLGGVKLSKNTRKYRRNKKSRRKRITRLSIKRKRRYLSRNRRPRS